MALRLILYRNGNYLRGLVHSSVFKSSAGVLRVKFLVLLVMLFLYVWTQISVHILDVHTHIHTNTHMCTVAIARPQCCPAWLQISVQIIPAKMMSSVLAGKGEGGCWGMQCHHTRLLLVTGCFCFCLVAEREIKWEKEGAACEGRILPTEVL